MKLLEIASWPPVRHYRCNRAGPDWTLDFSQIWSNMSTNNMSTWWDAGHRFWYAQPLLPSPILQLQAYCCCAMLNSWDASLAEQQPSASTSQVRCQWQVVWVVWPFEGILYECLENKMQSTLIDVYLNKLELLEYHFWFIQCQKMSKVSHQLARHLAVRDLATATVSPLVAQRVSVVGHSWKGADGSWRDAEILLKRPWYVP